MQQNILIIHKNATSEVARSYAAGFNNMMTAV